MTHLSSHSRSAPLFALLFIALALPIRAGDYSAPGLHQPGWRDITVTRPDTTTFAAAVYYPALTPGSGAPLDPAGGPYAAISFGHGYLMTVDKYQSTLEHLASWGFIVIAPRSAANFFPSHQTFANDLSQCLTQLAIENANAASWLFAVVDENHFAMSGHSMGGGCSILATAADPRIRVLANLAAAETNPSAIAAMPAIGVPVFLISGSEDGIVPVQNHGQRMYNNGNPPLQLPLLLGGYHCGFMDFSVPFCDSGSMPRDVQLSITRRLLTATFSLYLKNDQSAWRTIWGPESLSDPNVQLELNSGISLTAANTTLTACPGQTLAFAVTLKNSGPTATTYSLAVEDNAWPADAIPNQTDPLVPGETRNVTVEVATPTGPGPATDAPLLSARSNADAGTRTYLMLSARRAGITGDLDLNAVVDLSDLAVLLSNYGLPGTPETGDLDDNQFIDLSDISILLSHFGENC